jgi:hypothetical protein
LRQGELQRSQGSRLCLCTCFFCIYYDWFDFFFAPRYGGVAKQLGLVASEPRTAHRGVILARASRSGGGDGSSSGGSSVAASPLAAANRILVVDRRAGDGFRACLFGCL